MPQSTSGQEDADPAGLQESSVSGQPPAPGPGQLCFCVGWAGGNSNRGVSGEWRGQFHPGILAAFNMRNGEEVGQGLRLAPITDPGQQPSIWTHSGGFSPRLSP